MPECDIDECGCSQDTPGNENDPNCHYCNGLNMACLNTVGTYVCSCGEGYDWNPEKCSDTSNGNAQGRCPTEDNNFWVNGENGLFDPGAGDVCVDANECNGENCISKLLGRAVLGVPVQIDTLPK